MKNRTKLLLCVGCAAGVCFAALVSGCLFMDAHNYEQDLRDLSRLMELGENAILRDEVDATSLRAIKCQIRSSSDELGEIRRRHLMPTDTTKDLAEDITERLDKDNKLVEEKAQKMGWDISN